MSDYIEIFSKRAYNFFREKFGSAAEENRISKGVSILSLPIVVFITWIVFGSSPIKAAVISILEIAAAVVENLLHKKHPQNEPQSPNLKKIISLSMTTALYFPLALIIISTIINAKSSSSLPKEIWEVSIKYFNLFSTISSLKEFVDGVSALLSLSMSVVSV